MIGFRPNNDQESKDSTKPDEDAGEVNFEALWDKLLDLSSPEVRDAYYDHDHKHRS